VEDAESALLLERELSTAGLIAIVIEPCGRRHRLRHVPRMKRASWSARRADRHEEQLIEAKDLEASTRMEGTLPRPSICVRSPLIGRRAPVPSLNRPFAAILSHACD